MSIPSYQPGQAPRPKRWPSARQLAAAKATMLALHETLGPKTSDEHVMLQELRRAISQGLYALNEALEIRSRRASRRRDGAAPP